jgi:APA family basic amino acid/polyamine antiporter
MVVLKLAVIAFFLGLGAFYVKPEHWKPFAPNGFAGVSSAAAIIFFAYIGFDAVSTAAQEAKNPQRDLPIGILGSLAICTLLYVAVSAILTGMVPYTELNVAAPVAYAIEKVGAPSWIRILVDVGAVLGLGSVILVMLLGQSRVFYSMSRDGLLGKWAARVHPKFRTPYLSTIFTGIAVGLATGILPLQLLGQLVNIGTLLAFVLVCFGVLILRKTRPDLDRPFRTPWVPFVPIMGILCCVGLMATLPMDTWIRLIVWLLIGFAIYFGYGKQHSVLQQQREAGTTPK